MPDIVLTTLNARYWHSSFGLRYLMANMGELQGSTVMLEFGIGDRSVDMIAEILSHNPRIVGVGVYIWNVEPATQLVADLKRVRPDIVIVLGGPEVSYEIDGQPIVQLSDFVVTGEADRAFPELCGKLLRQNNNIASNSTSLLMAADELVCDPDSTAGPMVIHGGVPALDSVALPYHLYSDEDIAQRVIYVEVSRGCPFTCEFCLSALDIPVRMFDLNEFLDAMQGLLDRGAKQFKFVDRTFNLNMRVSTAILQYFLERMRPGLFLHFEMIPDRLPESLRELIAKFPEGVLQFEIGVQTFNDDVGELISRRQDNQQLENNFRFLKQQTGVHIHADLIIGLPGESIESLALGFDRLEALQPQEIQVGILKRLKGTPITRHDQEWQMVYSGHPPFEILSNRLLDFDTVHRLRRFARYWDLVANSGNFSRTYPLMWADGHSAFGRFLQFSDWLFAREQKTHGIPLGKLAEILFTFLTDELHCDGQRVAVAIWSDYVLGGRKDKPAFLRPFELAAPHEVADVEKLLPSRQARHSRS
ncbi:MAG: DUF4080 domain-containing protein [Fuerstiella sp.]